MEHTATPAPDNLSVLVGSSMAQGPFSIPAGCLLHGKAE